MEKIISCDFETTNTIPARVWAGVAVSVDTLEVLSVKENLRDFLDFIFSMDGKVIALFHNAKFDASFIIDYVERNGWKYDEELSSEKSYSAFIDGFGKFYSMRLRFGKKTIEIKDTLKLIPLKVEKMPEAFGLEGIKKGSIDYNKDRPEGYHMTQEEREYVVTDALIVAKSVKSFLSEGMTKNTIGGNSLSDYTESIGGYKAFRSRFPVLKIEDDDFIRRSYKGGWCYANPEFCGRIINESGEVLDINSLYPSIMKSESLPMGYPERFSGEYKENRKYPLFIERIKISFRIKPGHFPFIQPRHTLEAMPGEMISESNGKIEMTVTNVDLEMIKEHYDILSIEYLGGLMFRSRRGMFEEFLNKWVEIKEKSEGGRRQIAKLILNNLYGKFGTNPRRATRRPFMNGSKIEYKTEGVKIGKPIYTALSSFVTAYGRRKIVKAAYDNKENFLYADTDSIHIKGKNPINIEQDQRKLGLFKVESTFKSARYVHQKAYIEEKEEGGYIIKAAGMSEGAKAGANLQNFEEGGEFNGNLKAKTVEGGTILKDYIFTLK